MGEKYEWGVKANLRDACKYARAGALCWVLNLNAGWGGERLTVLLRSRGGRQIEIWVSTKRLHNLRVAWMPPHIEERVGGARWKSKEDAQKWATGIEEAWCVKSIPEASRAAQ